MKSRGSLYIVSAPSGTGKTSLVKALLDSLENIKLSISHTTRSMRPGEIDGVHYHFVERAVFETMIAHGDFFEHAQVYDNLYGTSKSWVEAQLAQGIDVILEIEWQGARQIRAACQDVVSIFIFPPAISVLEERLRARGQDDESVILRRLAEAREEIRCYEDYDYIVVNDKFETALSDLRSIIRAEHCRKEKQSQRFSALAAKLLSS
jgi:guanylate kinase